MTVETESGGLPVLKSGPYNGNGVTAAFDYDFPVQDETEIEVLRQNADLSVTTLTLTTHYTVSDVGEDAGGQVTIVTPATNLPTGTKLLIRYSGDYLQAVDWSNQSGLQLAQLEASLDKQMMHLRQIKEQLDRTAQTDAFEETNLAELIDALVAAVAIAADIATVAGISANVTTVAGDSADIATLAAISTDISAAAAIASEIVEAAGISADLATVAAIDAEIATLAGIAADITALATATGGTLAGDWTASGYWNFSGTGALKVPAGTTAQRPGTPAEGMVRKNSTTGRMEAYVDGAWRTLLATDGTLTEGDLFYVNASGKLTRLPAGTEGQVLTQGASVPAWGDATAGGSRVLLSTTVFSGETSYEPTLDDGTDYYGYEIVFVNVVPSSDAAQLRLRTKTGGVEDSGTSDYVDRSMNEVLGGTAAGAESGTTSSSFGITIGVGSAAGETGISGKTTVLGHAEDAPTRFKSEFLFTNSSGAHARFKHWGVQADAAAKDGLVFFFGSGNFESGTAYLYGLVK